jgi:predicted dehydrogenase
VYVEWPLGKSLSEARELLRLKNEGGVKHAIIGLQARQAPIIKKLKELVEGGRIGKVLSSTWVGQGGSYGEMAAQGAEYLGPKKYGGNLVSIRFGHEFDFFQQGISFNL